MEMRQSKCPCCGAPVNIPIGAVRVRITKTSANHLVIFASFASRVLALPLERKVSAPPEMAPERPALLPLCIRTIAVTARPERT